VRLLVSRPTPNLRARVSLFIWLLPLDLSGMGDATAGIALRVSGALKPQHHDKVETQSVRFSKICYHINFQGRRASSLVSTSDVLMADR
jgi:hypothetical protein